MITGTGGPHPIGRDLREQATGVGAAIVMLVAALLTALLQSLGLQRVRVAQGSAAASDGRGGRRGCDRGRHRIRDVIAETLAQTTCLVSGLSGDGKCSSSGDAPLHESLRQSLGIVSAPAGILHAGCLSRASSLLPLSVSTRTAVSNGCGWPSFAAVCLLWLMHCFNEQEWTRFIGRSIGVPLSYPPWDARTSWDLIWSWSSR